MALFFYCPGIYSILFFIHSTNVFEMLGIFAVNKRLSSNLNGQYILIGERNKLTNVKRIPQSQVMISAMERNKTG